MTRAADLHAPPPFTHVGHQQETHQVEAETQSSQEQGLVERVEAELRELVQHSCGDALHVAKLCGAARRDGVKGTFILCVCVCVCEALPVYLPPA